MPPVMPPIVPSAAIMTDREQRTATPAGPPAAASSQRAAAPEAPAAPALQVGAPPASYTLDASDSTESSFYYDSYRLRLGQDEAVRIDMDSPHFDTVLEIIGPQGGEVLGSNDDSTSDSLNSRLYFTASAAGDYLVRARGFRLSDIGDYRLAVVRMPSPPRLLPIPQRQGMEETEQGNRPTGQWAGSVTGSLGDSSPVIDESRRFGDDYRYARYAFRGEAGDHVVITMTSAALNARLRLIAGDYSAIGASAGNEQPSAAAGGEHRAILSADLPFAGEYVVWAEGRPTESGPFRLYLERTEAGARANTPPPSRDLSLGEIPTLDVRTRASGILGPGAGEMLRGDGSGEVDFFYQMYRLPVILGHDLTVDVTAGFFVAIEAGVDSPVGFAVGQMSTPSTGVVRLVLQPTHTGEILIRVRTLGAGNGGYIISVADGAQPPPPAS
ncbi:MAG TPA: PPC domain-containing protein [Allosphingosinicella sp.]|nr:PPC domain-containing protein [Allosphingosinicella sp.]